MPPPPVVAEPPEAKLTLDTVAAITSTPFDEEPAAPVLPLAPVSITPAPIEETVSTPVAKPAPVVVTAPPPPTPVPIAPPPEDVSKLSEPELWTRLCDQFLAASGQRDIADGLRTKFKAVSRRGNTLTVAYEEAHAEVATTLTNDKPIMKQLEDPYVEKMYTVEKLQKVCAA